MKDSSHTAIVVGGGLAGLSAAYRLQQSGWAVTVLEATDTAGGRAASVEKQGYLIDTGATGVGDCYTSYMALIAELGLSDRMVEMSPITGTFRDGVVHEIDGRRPLISGLRSRLFSWRSKLAMLRLVRDARAMGDKLSFEDLSRGYEWDDEDAETYALRRLNRELADYFVDPVLRALVVARARYLSKLELMNAMNGLFNTKLIAPLGGMSLLPKALARHFEVKYQSPVTHIVEVDGGVQVTYENLQEERQSIRADVCVIATLLPQAVALFPPCNAWVAPLADGLHYTPGISVALGYRRRTASKAIMVLLSAREVPDMTLLWLEHNKAVDRTPENHSLFYLWYDDAVADQAGAKTDETLAAECAQVVERIFPEVAGTLDMTHVTRWPAAVPMPVPGYYQRMHAVRANLDRNQTRIQLAGDYLSGVGQNTAVHYGEVAARKLDRLFGARSRA